MKKLMIFIVCLIPFVLIFSIQITSEYIKETQYVAVEKISFDVAYDEITLDSDSYVVRDISVKVVPLAATNKSIMYKSSDESVAVIDNKGVVKFIGFGKVTITAISNASNLIYDSCEFLVTDTKPHKIILGEHPSVIDINTSFTIESEVIPKEALDKTITYSSSDPSILKVSPVGKVTAVGKGKATITLRTVNDVQANFDVEVNVPVTGVEVEEGSYKTLTGYHIMDLPIVNVLPENASNKNVVFESKTPDIAEIVGDNVVFKTAGRATFAVKTEDGNFEASWSVNYTGGYVLSAYIKEEYKNISTSFAQDKVLAECYDIIEYNPIDADVINNIEFTSLNENVVKIENNKIVVKGGGTARVQMTAKTGDAPIIEYINISISRAVDSINISDVDSNSPSVKLDYQILPADHTSTITFETSSSLATVTADGLVNFVGQGSVKVKISTSCGKEKTIIVTYTKPDASLINITNNNQQITVNYLDDFGLLFDLSLDMGSVTYSGYNDSILEYNADNQEFTAIMGGQTSIIANSNGKNVTIEVNVIRKAESLSLTTSDVTISSASALTAKDKIQFFWQVLPSDTTNKSVSFSVDYPNIATISETGLLEFKQAGTITLTASTVNGIKQIVTIRSTFGLPESFELADSSTVLTDVGESFKIEIINSFVPSDVIKENLTITYTTHDESIATVDSTGKIVAVDRGTTTINVQIGNVVKYFNVEVQVKPKQIKTYYNGNVITSGSIIGNSIKLEHSILPENANNQNIYWQIVEGASLATISQTGLITFSGYGLVKAKIIVVGTDVSCEVLITRKNIDKLDIFDSDGNNVSSYYQSGSLVVKTLEIEPTDTKSVDLKIEITATNLLDPENLDYSMIETSYVADDDLTINSIEYLGDGYYRINKTANKNKMLCVTLTFAIGDVSSCVKIQYNNLQSLSMALKNEEDVNFGLEGKRVFATWNYDATITTDYKYTNVFDIEYSRYPATNEDELYWFTDRSDLAIVNENEKLILQPNKILTETKITVTVSNKPDINDSTAIKTSYVYTFVGNWVMNIYNEEAFNWAITNDWGLVLQVSLGTEEDDTDHTGNPYSPLTTVGDKYNSDTKTVIIAGMIWGNGYTLNFNMLKNSPYSTSGSQINFMRNVTNATIKGENFDSEKDYKNIIVITGGENTFSYCRIQQMKKAFMNPQEGWVTCLKNCIVKHASQCGLQIGAETVGNIYLENTIFYDVAQAAVDYGNGILHIKGIFDVYNFTSPNDYSGITDTLIKSAIKGAYQSDEFSRFVYKGSSTNVNNWQANVAIAMLPQLDGLSLATQPNQTDVYFWNDDVGDYVLISEGVENQTGLNYERVCYDYQTGVISKKSHYVYMVLSPYDSTSYVQPDTILDETGESKVYSPEKLEAIKNKTSS